MAAQQHIGLYDQHGILRFAGGDLEACLAYAQLFGLEGEEFSLLPLTPAGAIPAAQLA